MFSGKMVRPRYIIALLMALCTLAAHAAGVQLQDGRGRFPDGRGRYEGAFVVTQADGLGGESVYRIMRDHAGRLWMTTMSSLSTYNGKRILTYKFQDANTAGAGAGNSRPRIISLCESASHTIFVGTSKGVYALPYGGNTLECVVPDVENVENIMADGNTIYIGAKDGLHIYDGKHAKKVDMGQLNYLEYLPRHFQKTTGGASGNIIWFSTRYCLYAYNPATGALKNRKIAAMLPYNTILGDFAFCGNKLYVGTKNNGLFVMDRIYDAVGATLTNPRKVEGVGHVISSIKPCGGDNTGKICVATEGSGAYVVDAATSTVVEHYGTGEEGDHHIPTDVVNCFERTSDGVNLFGFTRYGFGYTYYSANLFKTYSCGSFSTKGLDVRSFCHSGNEYLIGTQRGFYYANDATGETQYVLPSETEGGHIVVDIQRYNGQYYIGTFDGGLSVFNPKTRTLRRQSLHPLLSYNTIGAMQTTPDGSFWVGSSEGLFVVDKSGAVRRYCEQNSRLGGGMVRSVVFDQAGNAWISTGSGLYLYAASSHSFENSIFPQGFFHANTHLYLSIGHQHTIYASDMNKVYYTDEKMTRFGEMPIPQKVSEEVCRQFLDDRQGSFWMATEKGLFRSDYQFGDIRHYGYSEGISGTNTNKLYLEPDGTLWVCTSDGLAYTNIRRLTGAHNAAGAASGKPYHAQLYNIRKGGQLLDLGEETIINDERSLSLAWNITSAILSFLPILPDYSKQSGRLYEYKLDGEDDWQLLLDGEEATVRSLLPGRHHLLLRLAGQASTESDFTITVLPSWLAVAEFIALLVALFLLLSWHRYRKDTRVLLEERNEIEGALLESEQQRQDAELQADELQATGEPQKYSRVKLNEDECASIVRRMREYIEKNKIYTNPELKMSDLAKELGVSSSKLSQVFNLYVKENYYDFINRYRLDEFKRLIDTGEHKRFTLTAISEKCGFKKSSFFSTFRKVEGMTPSEYLAEYLAGHLKNK